LKRARLRRKKEGGFLFVGLEKEEKKREWALLLIGRAEEERERIKKTVPKSMCSLPAKRKEKNGRT